MMEIPVEIKLHGYRLRWDRESDEIHAIYTGVKFGREVCATDVVIITSYLAGIEHGDKSWASAVRSIEAAIDWIDAVRAASRSK